MNNRQIGRAYENYACKYLKDSGYRIIKQNFFSPFGEIDIIAVKDKSLVFVEVKARLNNSFGPPSESLTPSKIRHIKNTINYFLLEDSQNWGLYLDYDKRVDFIAISCHKIKPKLEHIENISF